MRHILCTAALLAGACTDDSSSKIDTDAGATAIDSSHDSGAAPTDTGPRVTPNVVTNAGAACATASACTGASPSCQTTLALLGQEIPFPGGYCSSPCQDSRECGAAGECPVGESLKSVPAALRPLIGPSAPSNCYQHCSSDSDCRSNEKYRCATIASALSEGAGPTGLTVGGLDLRPFLSGPVVDNKYCLPPAPALPDAGPTPLDASTPDAGVPEAAAPDAAASDAAPADAANHAG